VTGDQLDKRGIVADSVTALEALDGGPVPIRLVAVIVNV
jgi:hypothetical protein